MIEKRSDKTISVNASSTRFPEFDLEWQMTACEQFTLVGLLERLRPQASLEIGSYRGGSLQVLSRYSNKVVSVDIDPSVEKRLGGKFSNVKFRLGDSKTLLPEVVQELNKDSEAVGFILIDGDHSAVGVRRDIEAVLQIEPKERIVIILHDSFNPGCREGMRTARWADCPHVHYVELDFIPGIYHFEAHDTAEARTMWGALHVLSLSLMREKANWSCEKVKGGSLTPCFAIRPMLPVLPKRTQGSLFELCGEFDVFLARQEIELLKSFDFVDYSQC